MVSNNEKENEPTNIEECFMEFGCPVSDHFDVDEQVNHNCYDNEDYDNYDDEDYEDYEDYETENIHSFFDIMGII